MKWEKKQLQFSALDGTILRKCHVDWYEMKQIQTINPNLPPLWSPLAYLLLFFHFDSLDLFWKEYRLLQRLRKRPEAHYYDMRLTAEGKKARDLSIPDYQLRKHQNFIHQKILSHVEFPDCVIAYRKGFGISDCAKPHLGAKVLIHLDIKDFFGSIRKADVVRALEASTGYPRSVVQLLADLCCCRGVLPQGAPSSPALSNLVFRNCDEQLMKLAKQNGVVYTRYADDMYFSGAIEDPKALIAQVEHVLQVHHFRLNEEKTRIMRNGCPKKIMGLTVEDRLQVERSYRRKLRQELYYVERFGKEAKAAKAADSYLAYLQQLQGKVSYVLSADRNNTEFQEASIRLKVIISKEYTAESTFKRSLWGGGEPHEEIDGKAECPADV